MKTLLPMIALAASLVAPAEEMKLPDPLLARDGTRITDAAGWEETLRPQTLDLFREHVYGRMPVGKPADFSSKVVREDRDALDGKATLREIEIRFSGPDGEWSFRPVLLLPNGLEKPAPVFLLISHRSPDLLDPANANSFWPVREIVARGYATVAFDAQRIDPDNAAGYDRGVRPIFDEAKPGADAWATIAAWAWGASRVMDHLSGEPGVDAGRVAVLGHSRGGKASLWAGAEDTRFAMVISNQSGCSGAALARRKQGERVADINKRFPYWFCENYNQYNGREEAMPVDQHQLISLIAPRLGYVGSAAEDAWADPEGEFLSGVNAGPVYALYGKDSISADEMPAADVAVHGGAVGYHMRSGKHDLNVVDWGHFMDFADHHWPR
jgi:dienelactone hydrolase